MTSEETASYLQDQAYKAVCTILAAHNDDPKSAIEYLTEVLLDVFHKGVIEGAEECFQHLKHKLGNKVWVEEVPVEYELEENFIEYEVKTVSLEPEVFEEDHDDG